MIVSGPLLVAGALIVGSKFILDFIETLSPGFGEIRKQEANSLWAVKEPEIADLILMYKFEEITIDEYTDFAARNGYGGETALRLLNISSTLLSVGDYISLWRRELMDEIDCDNKLNNLGLTLDEIQHAKNITEYFPTPMDLVRFAVREVYTPATVTEFGMGEDLPPEFITEGKKAGLNQEQAENYWKAHWDLPSPGMGYKMLHRRIIDEGQLGTLLKSLDIMPFWRDKLVQLSYNPLTRVDVRRMYRVGTLDEEGVLNAYLDTGYSPDNAQKMLEFTLQYENRDNVGITRSNVIKAYKKGIITEDNLDTYLTSLGYNKQVVNFWLSMSNYEKQQDELDDNVDEFKAQYSLGLINEDELRVELRSLDLPDSYVLKEVSKAVGKRSLNTKLPSVSNLHSWLQDAIIDEGQFSDYMKKIGYRENDIVNYMTSIRFTGGKGDRKYLPIKTYEAWLKKGIVSANQFETIALDMNIGREDINRMLDLATEE